MTLLAGRLTPGVGLTFGLKLVAAAIAVISAGLVLALESNWFAFTALTIAFAVVVGFGVIVLLHHQRLAGGGRPLRERVKGMPRPSDPAEPN